MACLRVIQVSSGNFGSCSENFVINLRDKSGVAIPNAECTSIVNGVWAMSASSFRHSNSTSCLPDFLLMDPLFIDVNGLAKIMASLKLSSSCGTDHINPKFLRDHTMLLLFYLQFLNSHWNSVFDRAF